MVEDVELAVDLDRREVQFRSATRIGAYDYDVEVR
jgi:uncharacterized protein (DUF1499 family)